MHAGHGAKSPNRCPPMKFQRLSVRRARGYRLTDRFAAGNPDRRSVQFPLSLTAEAVRA